MMVMPHLIHLMHNLPLYFYPHGYDPSKHIIVSNDLNFDSTSFERSTPGFSFISSLSDWLSNQAFITRLFIFAICLSETVWTCYYFLAKLHLSQINLNPPPFRSATSYSSRLEFYKRCKDEIKDYPKFISKWFKDTEFHTIKLGDIRMWLSWVFFNKHLEDLLEHEAKEFEGLEIEFLEDVKTRGILTLEEGESGASCFRHTLVISARLKLLIISNRHLIRTILNRKQGLFFSILLQCRLTMLPP